MIQKRKPTTVGAVAILAMLAAAFSSCSNPTTPDSTARTFISSSDNSHTHSFTMEKTTVQNPPAAGLTGTTSSNSAHTHTFSMTQAELMAVNSGSPVVVTTGSSDVGGAHTHTFTITKWF